MKVSLLYFDECPSWQTAADHLDLLATEISGLYIERVLVDTPEAAERTRFRGSPSIHVDGSDLFADPDAPVGLSCRIYQTPDGPAGHPRSTNSDGHSSQPANVADRNVRRMYHRCT